VYTLGVNLSRQRSACLLRDRDCPIAAVEAWLTGQPGDVSPDAFGRRRVSMPHRSVDYCLSKAGISYVDLDVIVFCDATPSAASATRKLNVADCVLRLPFSPQSRMLTIEPALAHAYSAYYLSRYDEAAIVVLSHGDSAAGSYGYMPGTVIAPVVRAEIFSIEEGVVFEVARASTDGLAVLGKKEPLEEIVLGLFALAMKKTGCDRLCVAGDHTLDQRAGLRIRNALNAREVFVQPFVDDVAALGAARYGCHHEQSPNLRV
jgi:predicted NodU family carbamoyl transferase